MPARTQKGVELNDYLQGLKLYISIAEKDRIAFHQGVNTADRTPIDLNNPAQRLLCSSSFTVRHVVWTRKKTGAKNSQTSTIHHQPGTAVQ